MRRAVIVSGLLAIVLTTFVSPRSLNACGGFNGAAGRGFFTGFGRRNFGGFNNNFAYRNNFGNA